MKVKVFKQEVLDGIEEQVANDLARCSFDIIPCEKFDVDLKDEVDKPQYYKETASVGDIDLFYFKSVHASTGINLNDNYFLAEELWKAKDSAAHKRINFQHEEENIIGTDLVAYATTFDGKAIENTTSLQNIPDQFDVVTKGILYRVWTDKARQKFMDKLISEIQDGEWSVSMEAMYPHWDYVLIDKAGQEEFIQRNSKTAHMTKHLRKFGGKGTYQDKRIGQVLRDMVFAGKGIVKKPANKRSIVLEVEESSRNIGVGEKNSNSMVYSNTEGKIMDKNEFEKELATVVAEKVKLESKVGELNVKMTELVVANTDLNKKLEDVKTLEQKVADQKTQFEKEKNELATASKVELEKVQASLDEVTKVVSEYKVKEVKALRVEEVKTKLGMEADKASEYVDTLIGFDDKQFELAVSMAVKISSAKIPTGETGKPAPMGGMPTKVAEINLAKAALDTANVEEKLNPTVVAEATQTPGKTAREDIVKFLGKKK